MEKRASKAVIRIEKNDSSILIGCTGDWNLKNITEVISRLESLSKDIEKSDITVDISAVEELDSAGAILLLQYVKIFREKMCHVNIAGADKEQDKILEMFDDDVTKRRALTAKKYSFLDLFEKIGRNSESMLHDVAQFLSFLGESFLALVHYVLHPSSIRFKAMYNDSIKPPTEI